MITNEDINTLYNYLSEQTLETGSDIEKLYTKIVLIKTLYETNLALRNLTETITPVDVNEVE